MLLPTYTFPLGAMRAESPLLSRRRLLGAAAAAAVVAGGALAVVRTRGYGVGLGVRLIAMSPWQFVVVEHAARRIAAPDRDDDESIPSPDSLGIAAFVDTWIARLPTRMQRDLGRFLAYLEHVAPLGVGFASRFTRLGPEAQDRVLASVERSSQDLLRAGFDGLKALVFIGYYRDARTWGLLGYDGPLVARPPGGWR
ncbi:MAG: gluconate 2-dehydrogenase subunit 3 family protein [Polyangiaceae bacterium]